MKKSASMALALMMALLIPGDASASITRLLSLGFDNWQVHDSANFWYNPALLRDAPDLLHLELGRQGGAINQTGGAGNALNAGSQWGGFHKAWGRHVFALYVRRPYGTADFSTIADPVTTPLMGGMVTNAGVVNTVGLDTGGFGTTGPFGTSASLLVPTGGDPQLAKNLAAPVNYFDAFWSAPAGPFSFGLRFNYGRNAPGELRRTAMSNVGSGLANEGTRLLERVTDEYNIQPGFSVRGERVRWDVVGHISLPYYRMDYEERRIDAAYTTQSIRARDSLGKGIGTQITLRTTERTSLAWNIRAGDQNTAGTAAVATDSTPGGALETNRTASYDNRRRYLGADMSWNHLFEHSLLAVSIGYQRSQTKQTWNFVDVLAPANNQDDTLKTDRDIVPLRLGMEMRPWERVAIRAGVQKNWFAESDVLTIDKDNVSGNDRTQSSTAIGEASGTADGVGLSFGMGFKLIQNLTVDTVVRQTFFFDGPNFVGGRNPGLFASGTLVYRFGLSSNDDDTLKPLLSYDEIQLY